MKKDSSERPPLGLMPEQAFIALAAQQRVQQIIDAMKRYSEAGKSVPMAWIEELERRTK
jgi:hypothetical protein